MAAITITDLDARIAAALLGAVAGEGLAGTPAGARQLLAVAESLAAHDGVDEADLTARGLASLPASGPAAAVVRALPAGLLTPLERPLLRRSAHRIAALSGVDEGTAMTAVAAAVLIADLLRFDLDVALVRLRQTLLEEAPSALLRRLAPLDPGTPLRGTGDPGDSLQLAITVLDGAATLPQVLDDVASLIDGDAAAASVLAGALAGARSGLDGADDAWLAAVPARERARTAAAALAATAARRLPA